MIADLLLRPDNRLLGGATGDFSLFGGQPTPGMTFARENAANGHVSIAAPSANDAMSGAPAPVSAATSPPGAPVEEIPAAGIDSANAMASAPSTSPVTAATPNSSAPALDDLVPTALSSGGLVMAGFAALGLANSIPVPPPASPAAAPNPLAPAGASFDAPTLDQLVPTAGALTTTIAPIADVVGDLAAIAEPAMQAVADDVIDPLATGVADLVDTVDPALAPIVDTVAPVVTGVGETIAPVTSGVAAIVTPAVATIADVAAPVGTALGTAADAAGPVVAAVTPAVDPVLDAVAPVVNAATPLADAATDTVSPVAAAVAPAIAPIVDAVQPAGVVAQPAAEAVATVTGEALGGSDPEGGVQTLVGMVANADAFDVIAPGAASAEELAPSVIDDLIGDASEVAPLLGDHDGAHDDDGTDLFGGHGGLGLG
ncbi:MAG: hypothetical protein PGN21_03925 [Sphingomonas paucimobilis]